MWRFPVQRYQKNDIITCRKPDYERQVLVADRETAQKKYPRANGYTRTSIICAKLRHYFFGCLLLSSTNRFTSTTPRLTISRK